MAASDYAARYCVIGAGSSGIAAAKNLKELGIACDAFEREDAIGGNWYFGKPNSSIYRSTHLISSKPLTEYTDYPMPAEYPDFPAHEQVLAYLRDYAQRFGLTDSIQFNTSVERIEPADSGACWDVTLMSNGI